MIITRHGRAQHLRLPEEDAADIESSIGRLNRQQREMLLRMINEASVGAGNTYQMLRDNVYDREMVDILTFVEDDYYLGTSCKTLFPPLKKELLNIFESSRYQDVILTGSIGWGKTFLGSIIFCRILYELSCLRSPAETFGLSPASEIFLFVLSKSLHTAETVVLGKVMEKIKTSPYFEREFPWSKRKDGVSFPKNITVEIGSVNSERALGLDVIAFLMDETNFMGGSRRRPVIQGQAGQTLTAANFDQAEKLYTKLTSRIKSRFLQCGKLPGKTVLMSSKTTNNSFTERRIKERKDDPNTYVVDKATWDVKPASSFSGEFFRVLVGSQGTRSRILTPGEQVPEGLLRKSGSTVIRVPINYIREFQINLADSIRDVAGMSTDSMCSFITMQSSLYRPTIREDLIHPFSSHTWTLLSAGFEIYWVYLCIQTRRPIRTITGTIEEMVWKPFRHPDAVRVIHIDIGFRKDALGIAMGHITRMVDIERASQDETYIETAPEMEIDFALQVRPQQGDYILLQDIRALIYAIRDHGFTIELITFDSHQSSDGIQILRANGFNADVISVDKGTGAYDALRLALYEGRMRMYESPIFLQEMVQLEYDPVANKVDHPVGGSKDVADAVAGVAASLELMAYRTAAPMLVDRGAQAEEDADLMAMMREPNPRAPIRHLDSKLRAALSRKAAHPPAGTEAPSRDDLDNDRRHAEIPAHLPDASSRTKVGKGDGNEKIAEDNLPILF